MKILVSGATGFLAESLLPRLKGDIRVVDRNEGKLIKLKQKYPDIEIITGDISQEWIVKKAMKGIDEVYHLAAMKHVDLAEKQPFECIQSNVIGTLNLLVESLNERPKTFIMISTDKAAQVNGVYGATKFLGEKLIKEAEMINQETKYRVVRYGNVWKSTGSFITKWIPNIKKGEGIKITDPDMTRFFWTVDEAVDLIFECIAKAKDSTPYIPRMKAMRMGDIVIALKEMYGDFKVETIGNRGGENQSETMDGILFSDNVERYSIKEIMELI